MIEKTSMSQPHLAQRINVVGTTGAGKTTVARRLSEILCIPHVEIDALFWGPNWGRAPADILAQRVAEATSPGRWVVDGNYSVVRDLIWPKATGIVWLDYPFPVVFLRLLSRTVRRVFFKEDLWNGNRERFHAQFMSRDSLFLWALRTHRRRRKQLGALLQQPEYAHLEVVRLRSSKQTTRWLQDCEKASGSNSNA